MWGHDADRPQSGEALARARAVHDRPGWVRELVEDRPYLALHAVRHEMDVHVHDAGNAKGVYEGAHVVVATQGRDLVHHFPCRHKFADVLLDPC